MTSVATKDADDEQYSLGADFKVTFEGEEVKAEKDEDVATILYSHRSKLYHFIKEDNYGDEVRTNYWKERGLGDIKIMQDKKTNTCRILMRQEKTLKPVLNCVLSEEVELAPNTSVKSWVFNCHDFSDGEVNLVQCAAKFKTQEIANEFRDALNNAKVLHAAAVAANASGDASEDASGDASGEGESKATKEEADLAAIDKQAASYHNKEAKRRGSIKAQSALADSDYDSNEEDVDEGDEARLRAQHGIAAEGDAATASVTDAMANATIGKE